MFRINLSAMKVAVCFVFCLFCLDFNGLQEEEQLIYLKKPVSEETGFETLFPFLYRNIIFGNPFCGFRSVFG